MWRPGCDKIQTSHTLLGCCAQAPVLPEQTHDTEAAVRGSRLSYDTHVGLCIYYYFSFLSHGPHCSVQDQVFSKSRFDTSVSSWNPSDFLRTSLLSSSLQGQAGNQSVVAEASSDSYWVVKETSQFLQLHTGILLHIDIWEWMITIYFICMPDT